MAVQQVSEPRTTATPGARVVADARIPGVENLGQLVCRAAEAWGDRPAWRFDATAESLTFAEVEKVTRHLAGRLAAAGIRSGDHVAVLATNTLEFPATWLALARLGAVIVPLNVNYRPTDASHVVQHAQATTLLTIDEFLPLAAEVAKRCPAVQRVLPIAALLAGWRAGTPEAGPVELDEASRDHTANIQYTSGTTGKPKGCILAHDYWLAIAFTLTRDFPHLAPTDVMLTVQPFHYIDPQWNVVSALLAGAELVILDRFHPSTFWQQVRDYDVTYFYCLGLMPTLLLRMPPSADDTSNRVRAVQASAIPATLHRTLEERWGAPWFEAYGMTETGADLYVDTPEHDELVGSGSLGRPRSHRDARVVDAAGHPCAPDAVGQLQLRGPGLMRGYFNDAVATAAAFTDGWFRTGDLACADSAGRLYYRGRTKDMIRRSGENISANEVEDVLALHPGVDLAAVVAVPDALRGEEALAFILVVPGAFGAAGSPDAARAFITSVRASCAAEIAYFKVPRYWRLATSLPRTVSERVAKHELTGDDTLRGAWDSQESRWLD